MFTWRIGKEDDRWEEQFYHGYDPETQIEYGTDEQSAEVVHTRICEAVRVYGATGISQNGRGCARAAAGDPQARSTTAPKTLAKLLRAISEPTAVLASVRPSLHRLNFDA
jgi:hypothetical protein